MDEEDFANLLRFTRERMRELGLESLSDRISADLRTGDDRPSQVLLRYFSSLETELRLASSATVRKLTDRYRSVVQTDSGRTVEGIRLLPTGADQQLFGTDPVDLTGDPGLEPLIDEISRVRSDLLESRQ